MTASTRVLGMVRAGVVSGAWRRPRPLLLFGSKAAPLQPIDDDRFMGRPSFWAQVQRQQMAFLSSYPPHQVVGLPSLSPTMETGSISSWHLQEGDSFAPGSTFCSVETDKATMDFECQEEGILAKILRPAGPADIRVGDPILITVDDASHVSAFANYQLSTTSTPTPSTETAVPSPPPPPSAAAAPSATTTTAPIASSQPATTSTATDRVVASPLAHKLAKELGYAISSISGTGPGGRIIAADVKEYKPATTVTTPAAAATTTATTATGAAPPSAVPAPVVSSSALYTDYPVSELAVRTAQELMQSKRTVPHYYLSVDLRCDALLALRATLNAAYASTADKKSPPPTLGVYEFMIKAAAMSMKAVPSVNASWIDTAVRVYHSVDVNVVLGNGDTLYTPVITQCEQKGLVAISQDLQRAVAVLETSTTGTSSSAPNALGTFTVVNLGMYGVKSCAPIVRTPQSCALAIGVLENRIVPSLAKTSGKKEKEDENEIYQESVMCTVTLSCDHRVVDGAVGAQWLATFRSYVENPSTLLL